MSEIPRDVERLGAALTLDWHRTRAAAISRRIAERHTSERRRRTASAVTLLLVGVVATAYVALRPADLAPRTATAPALRESPAAAIPETLPETPQVAEVAQVTPAAEPVAPGTRFTLEEGVARREYSITHGAVRFTSGGARAEKQLVVRVGTLEITDIGTVFTVESPTGEGATVSVMEGSVRVAWPGGQATLEAGEEGTYPPVETGAEEKPASKPTIAWDEGASAVPSGR